MSKNDRENSARKKEIFRKNFLILLDNNGVPENRRGFFLNHLRLWSRWLRDGRRPAGSEAIEVWVREIDGNPRWSPFQIKQALLAIEWAHGGVLKEEWVSEVDWGQLRSRIEEAEVSESEMTCLLYTSPSPRDRG